MGGNTSQQHKETATFLEHVSELRGRLMWASLAIVAGAALGYFLHDSLLRIIQKPLGQTLYNTTPTGAFSFVIKICVIFGLLVGLPVIMYQLFCFLGPLLSKKSKGVIILYTFWSVILAVSGAVFAYFISLPAALNFLVNFGNNTNIESIITANEYFNFAFAYILGMAAIFQLPLVLLFINRVTPLPPIKMIGAMRYILVASFIVAAIITPTPDPMNQTLMAAPIVGLYAVSIGLVWAVNTRHKKKLAKRGSFAIKQPVQKTHDVAPRSPLPAPEPKQAQHPTFQPRPLVARPSFAMDVAAARVHTPTTEIRATRPAPASRPAQPVQMRQRLISDFR